MQAVDLSKYLTNIESHKKDFINNGLTHRVPEKRIIKDHLGENNYRVLLCTFNEPSFQGVHNFQITKERLTEQMDKFVGRQIGEKDQQDLRGRLKNARNASEYIHVLKMRITELSCGTLVSYEIIEDTSTGVIELFGVVNLKEVVISPMDIIPHYFTIRCIGEEVRSDKKPYDFRVMDICGFDIDVAFFN